MTCRNDLHFLFQYFDIRLDGKVHFSVLAASVKSCIVMPHKHTLWSFDLDYISRSSDSFFVIKCVSLQQ